MNEQFFPYAKQSIEKKDVDAVKEALKSDWITRGPKVEEFEQIIAEYCGAKYAVAFNSGSTALMATAHAADINSFDRVLTTPNTYVATVSNAMARGATPVFIDIDLETGNLNLEQLKINLEYQSTRGRNVIIPVHFAGIPVDMEHISKTLTEPDAVIIEDAAHAIGSSYTTGEKVGSCVYSDMTIFSFHPAKTLTTGEGGLVTTNSDDLYHRLKRFRNNGIEKDFDHPNPWYYEVVEIAGNYNFTDMQAALGLAQLERLDLFVEKRRKLMAVYREKLKGVEGIKLFTDAFDAHTSFHLCVVQIDFEKFEMTRAEVMNFLKEKGIGTQVHYIPVYRHSFFTKEHGDISEYFPNTEQYYAEALSLPLYYDLKEGDVEFVVESLLGVLEGAGTKAT